MNWLHRPALAAWRDSGLLAAALGALQTLAFVHTAAWPLPLLAIAWLVHWLDRARPGRAAWLAWCFGVGWLVAGTWWLFVSMHRYGQLPAPLAAAGVLALAAALSLYLALAGGLYARWRSAGAWRNALLFAALWLLAELARGVLFTGFPWVASGYAQIDGPLALLAPWVGVYGMGAVLAFAAARLAGIGGWPWRAGLVGLALLAAAVPRSAWLGPDFTRPHGTPLALTLIQPNVAQDEKFALERMPQALEWLAQAMTSARGPLVVGPETAIPLLPGQLDDFDAAYWPALRRHFAAGQRAALIGLPLGDFSAGYTNSVAGLGGAAPYRYDKHHLVPFGEFIPSGFRWFTKMMQIPLGDFSRGLVDAPSFEALGQRLAPNICYEDLFGEELAVRFRDAAKAPTVMVNLSNIGWFGPTVAVPQHLNISRLRTLELQRPMLRATNTGATAVIDHRGAVTAQLPAFTRGTLDAQVQGRSGTTPFAAWAAHAGLWPLGLLALLMIGLGGRGLKGQAGPAAPAAPP